MKAPFAATLPLLAFAAQAHPGHDMPGASHWHGTDALGYLLLAAAAGAAAWWLRRK